MSPQDLKGEQPLLQRSWLGITSILPHDEGHPFPTSQNQWVPHAVTLPTEQDSSCNHHQCLSPHPHQPRWSQRAVLWGPWSPHKATLLGDKLIILGNFNARVSKVGNDWKGVLGSHSVGNLNSNSLLLLSKCAEHRLCITSTIIYQADKYKTTWMHPRSKQWHLIAFVIVKQRDIQDIRITHTTHGAECWTDHRLVRPILKLHIVPTQCKHPKFIRSPFNMARLSHPYHCNRFWEPFDERLKASASHAEDSSENWCQFKKIITETAKTVLGTKKCEHQDWFDENDEFTTQLLHVKN